MGSQPGGSHSRRSSSCPDRDRSAERAVAAWQRLPCTRVSIQPLVPEIWAARRSLRISDAHYMVLSLALSASC